MARTARNAGRKITVAGLLIAAACATVQQPPGGPPDFVPPEMTGTAPDSGAVLVGFEDDVSFQFNEVITEGSGDALRRLIHVSPRHEAIDVSWRRTRIAVKPDEGWRDSVTYAVTLLPGVTDLRNNRLETGKTVVFSTGGAIPMTQVSGTVVDWEGGRIAPRALVEVIRQADSLIYWTVSDSAGNYSVPFVPPGTYLLVATIDQNSNQARESREAYDTVTVTLDSLVARNLWTFVHDTIGPRISDVRVADSTALRVEFQQALEPDSAPPFDAVEVVLLQDSTPVPIARTMWPAAFDSLQATIRDSLQAIADSLARDSLAQDTLAQDTLAQDTLAVREPEPVAPDTLAAPEDSVTTPDIVSERPPLRRGFVLIVETPLVPGTRYEVRATVTNLLGIAETSARPVLVPAPPDSS